MRRDVRSLILALAAVAVLVVDATYAVPAAAREPERGSSERTAIVAAVRSRVEQDLGPPVVFTIRALNVESGWAYVLATPRRNDRDVIDWSRTRFARTIEAGFMSDRVMALLRGDGDRWQLVEYVLGPADGAWEDWPARHNVPRALFAPPARAGAESGSAQPAPVLSAVPAGWHALRLGDLAVATPKGWATPETAASGLRLGGEPWTVALASQPRAVEQGILVVLSWASPEAVYSATLEAPRIRGRQAGTLAGRVATRTEFAMRDAYNDIQGIDIVTRDPVAGGVLHAGCRAPSRQWPAAKAVCEQVLASVTVPGGAVASDPGQAPVQVPAQAPVQAPGRAATPAAPPATPARRATVRVPPGVDPFEAGGFPSASHAMPAAGRP